MQRVIAVGDMFGIAGRRDELRAVMARAEEDAATSPGCRRYVFSATLEDPDHVLLISEWETQGALDAHYRSAAFSAFQFGLEGLLARPSEMTVYTVADAVRPMDVRPMDPRDAD
jgi:quinol monooxygenase YgiN